MRVAVGDARRWKVAVARRSAVSEISTLSHASRPHCSLPPVPFSIPSPSHLSTMSSPAASPAPLAWSASELDRFDALLFDCDGVLWHETSPIPGAIETLQRLEDLGKKLLFATNNSGKSREAYMQKFGQLGFTVKLSPEQIFTSSQAAAHYLANLPDFDKTNQKVFTVGESGIGYELRAKGIECIEAMKLLGTTHMTKTELSKIEVDPTVRTRTLTRTRRESRARVHHNHAHLLLAHPVEFLILSLHFLRRPLAPLLCRSAPWWSASTSS